MPSLRAGTIMKCAHKQVVVLETGLKEGDEEAARIAPLSKTTPPSGPAVEFKDRVYGTYWVLVGQVSTVRAASLVTVWGGPDKVNPAVLKEVLQVAGK
ncbi:hypothetical protein [Lentzea albida]|uniref:Uncharacterized protein n=1 Tax=Lentzea albida TaxID=65499 RepID=A0A1H9MS80_9PSEU|nr:hypothetical protein [Lentzea albida]SER26564.1 hypothetical protein SAMN04488000_107192 [Lentzea albida]